MSAGQDTHPGVRSPSMNQYVPVPVRTTLVGAETAPELCQLPCGHGGGQTRVGSGTITRGVTTPGQPPHPRSHVPSSPRAYVPLDCPHPPGVPMVSPCLSSPWAPPCHQAPHLPGVPISLPLSPYPPQCLHPSWGPCVPLTVPMSPSFLGTAHAPMSPSGSLCPHPPWGPHVPPHRCPHVPT